MSKRSRSTVVLAFALIASILTSSAAMAHGTPSCSEVEFLQIEVHGDHIKRDYVFQEGATKAAGGARLPGGAGPAFHFVNQVAPGASFCTDANSSVIHEKNPNLNS